MLQKQNLCGTWQLTFLSDDKKYPAQIPGSVLSALLAEKVIPNPYDRTNEYEVRDLFWHDFSFTRDFFVDETIWNETYKELVCHGLDTLCDVYLNETWLGATNNMHRTWRFPIGTILKAGKNTIKVVCHSTLEYMKQYAYPSGQEIHYTAVGAMTGNQVIRKAHSMFGWDWGAQLPDAGIWRDIELQAWSDARLEHWKLEQIHEKEDVQLHVSAYLQDSSNLDTYKIQVTLKDEAGDILNQEMASVIDKTGKAILRVKSPKLWWPNGYGEQPLYQVTLSLFDESGSLLDKETKTIGFRTITISREQDCWGKEFTFVVNGLKIFARGGNYIPEDCVYQWITKERQAYLIDSMLRANFNCVRVWGGGYYPSDYFYELCDKAGLLVWQDFMYACNVYDLSGLDDENCRLEAIEQVRRLCHHASLALWCGNNELESAWHHWGEFQIESKRWKADYIKLFEYIIPNVVKEEDPATFYWQSSPSSEGSFDDPDNENNGDCHYWDVWHGQKPFTDYQKYYFRFCSEFGFQSFPCLKTIESFTRPEDRNIFSKVMESHQKNGSANGKILYYLSENFRYPNSFEQVLYVSQILQALAIRYGVEHWRRNRGRCMGALYWQLNDNWPVASWSSIDYYGRWKALHYYAKQFFAPISASFLRTENGIILYLCNETKETVSYEGAIRLKDVDCNENGEVSCKGCITPFSAAPIATFTLEDELLWQIKQRSLQACEQLFFEGSVSVQGEMLRCVEPLVPYKHMQMKPSEITLNVIEEELQYRILLQSNVFEAFVGLDTQDADVIFSDNYFFLTDKKIYEIYLDKKDVRGVPFKDSEDLKKRLQITTWNHISCCL